MKDKIHLALLLMCKNETKRIGVTLDSVIGYVNSFIVYDTGSTDDTISIIEEYSKKHNIPLRLKQGEFVDFATSRNVALEFADTFEDVDYLLLMDVNDELKGGDALLKYIKEHYESPTTGFLLCQEWWSGKFDKYFNQRLIKARKGWRYFGRVHEWLKDTSYESDALAPVKLIAPDNIKLYQDRTKDDDKSAKRFFKDREMLLKDHIDNPEDPRTMFYLAQTYSCTNQLEECLYYNKLRTKYDGFMEEKFHAYLRAGEAMFNLQHDWYDVMAYFLKAYDVIKRAEPLINIADYYKQKEKWDLSYSFIKMACDLEYPTKCYLFVDKLAYDYKRWHLMSIIAWQVKEYQIGYDACKLANQNDKCKEVDKNNLKIYETKLSERSQNMTRKEFTELMEKKLLAENPKLTPKKLHSQITKLWKERS